MRWLMVNEGSKMLSLNHIVTVDLHLDGKVSLRMIDGQVFVVESEYAEEVLALLLAEEDEESDMEDSEVVH